MALDASSFGSFDETLLFSAKLEAELTPFLDQRRSDAPATELASDDSESWGGWAFLAQQLSSSWGFRSTEFATSLFLITYFEHTLLPGAVYGFTSCVTNILVAPWLGSLVDKVPRLNLLRYCVAGQRLSQLVIYTSFAFLFHSKETDSALNLRASEPSVSTPAFRVLLLAAIILQASNTCMAIAVQQDWAPALSLSHGSASQSQELSSTNARLKRIDLACKLFAPLLVSTLSSSLPYFWVACVLGAISVFGAGLDTLLLHAIRRLAPALCVKEGRIDADMPSAFQHDPLRSASFLHPSLQEEIETVYSGSTGFGFFTTWSAFVQLPTFLSSIAVGFLAMNVFAFDGPMLSFLKTQSYDDRSLSLMRGSNVLAAFIGTMLAPSLEQAVGPLEAGIRSLWPAVLSFGPAVIAMLAWMQLQKVAHLMLFSGVIFSAVGIASFELVQMKQLQLAIRHHPKKSTLASFQYTLFHLSDLMKYILTMFFFHRPSDFKWTALISFVSIIAGAISYTIYWQRERYGDAKELNEENSMRGSGGYLSVPQIVTSEA